MTMSKYRLAFRVAAPLVAASLLAGVSLDAAAAGAKGQVRLQLGPQGNPSRFVYFKPDGTASTQVDTFSGSKGNEKCLFTWSSSSTLRLMDLAAFAPEGTSAKLGIGPDSIGVYNNSSGVSCYRVESRFNEVISLTLGTGLESRIETATGAPIVDGSLYFDRLELDVEVKGSAELALDVYRRGVAGVAKTYFLRSGTSIVPLEGTPGESGPNSPDEQIFNCAASSDSGPDSGPNDNCRWIINDLGTGFTVRALSGEVSLEGGGDFGSNNTANNTVIFLTTLVDSGTLYCNPNVDPQKDNKTAVVGGGPVASCQTTRINPNNLGQTICPIYPSDGIDYDLESFVAAGSECELRKKPGSRGVQIAGSTQITFEPEPSLNPWGSRQTQIRFADQYGNLTGYYAAPRCQGTVVDDVNGNPTILEVLSGSTPIWVADQIASNGFIDWACVLDHREVFLGDGKMQVIQTILFWGDIGWSRF